MILVVEREARDEDGVRLADGVLNRVPQLVVADRASVLIVERNPDRNRTEKRAGAAVLVAPCSGGFSREPEAEPTIPGTRWLARIRVAREYRDQRNVGA
jgi:hypothetical protein